MFLLDSDTFTHAFHNRHGIRERIARETETVALSPITRIESLRGRFDAVIKAAAVPELQTGVGSACRHGNVSGDFSRRRILR